MQTNPDTSAATSSWDSYWQGAGDAAAYSADGNVHPAIAGFWSSFFDASAATFDAPRIVDLACGNGALLPYALNAFGGDSADVTCVDISEKAIASIRERHPSVKTVVSDAADTGLPSDGFDIVISQFGVEYSGKCAIQEAVRLLAENGRLALLLHHTGSPIHRECQAGLDAVRRVRESGFIALATDYFSAGFEAVRGADRAPYEEAAKLLNPAVSEVEMVVREHGPEVAGGVIANLYNDVKRVHERIQNFEPSEVLDWLAKMDRQLEDYLGRMTTMQAAALDEPAFDEVRDIVTTAGCSITESGPLFAPGEQQSLAWALLASA